MSAAITPVVMPWDVLDRMERAVAKVRERLMRATTALERAGVPYAVVGGYAVASWVARIDEGAVRNTRDVDLMVRRADLPALTTALEQAGFVRDTVMDVDMFLDGPSGKASEAVHLLYAGEKVRSDHPLPNPDFVTEDAPEGFRVVPLEQLVRMMLLSNRRKDQVHLEDMLGVGLIDATWLTKLPPVLAARFQAILDTPGG